MKKQLSQKSGVQEKNDDGNLSSFKSVGKRKVTNYLRKMIILSCNKIDT